MAAVRHVGVVGAGLAGLAAALAAANAGMRVDVFERQAQPAAPAAHIDVVPNLLRDLVALGVGPSIVRRGFPYNGLAVLDGDGQRQFVLETPRLAGARFPAAVGMVYADLLAILRDQALAQGVLLHHGAQVVDADDGGAVRLADGGRVAVDLAVLACGEALPRLAGAVPRAMVAESLPQQWCHALLPRPPSLDRAAWVLGAAAHKLLLVPVDPQRIGIAVRQPAGAGHTGPEMRQALAARGPLPGWLAEHWKDDTPILLRQVRSGVLEGPWHAQGVLRIGASAHVLPPHFGQSAAQGWRTPSFSATCWLQAWTGPACSMPSWHAAEPARARSMR
jgi:2-polyprenyl-6-methoxyphenol hydroxylase-like FAD-dependent oxidoreductase